MFSVELKVNGVLIGHMYGHNKGEVDVDTDTCRYDITYHDPSTVTRSTQFTMRHKRSDGIEQLVKEALSQIITNLNQ